MVQNNDASSIGTIHAMLDADAETAWALYLERMGALGIETVLYAYIDTINHSLEDAPFRFKSTVHEGWFDHYYTEGFHYLDHALIMRKQGVTTPIALGSEIEPPEGFRDKATREMISQSGQAGFRSSLNFALSNHVQRSKDDQFAITLGTDGTPDELSFIMDRHRGEIDLLTSLLHTRLSYNVVRSAYRPLSPRERECLSWVAKGYRVDRIADRLALSNSAVNFHLRNARAKLHAKTLPEAIAIAVSLQMLAL